jgi:hypothetical protein
MVRLLTNGDMVGSNQRIWEQEKGSVPVPWAGADFENSGHVTELGLTALGRESKLEGV